MILSVSGEISLLDPRTCLVTYHHREFCRQLPLCHLTAQSVGLCERAAYIGTLYRPRLESSMEGSLLMPDWVSIPSSLNGKGKNRKTTEILRLTAYQSY